MFTVSAAQQAVLAFMLSHMTITQSELGMQVQQPMLTSTLDHVTAFSDSQSQ